MHPPCFQVLNLDRYDLSVFENRFNDQQLESGSDKILPAEVCNIGDS